MKTIPLASPQSWRALRGFTLRASARLALVVLLSAVVLLALLVALGRETRPTRAEGATLYVAPDGVCGGASPCYSTVQAAVDVASSSDVIKVRCGTYTDTNTRPRNDVTTTGVVTQMVYISKTVTIRGSYIITDWNTSNPTACPTTLDAQGQGRVLYITGNISPTIEGLRITRGDATGLGGSPTDSDTGGGVYVITATATISNNRVFSNTAYRGGGVYLYSCSATLNSNTVTSNTARDGGGIFLYSSPATLNSNTITSNTAQYFGGGVYLSSSPATLNGNTIISNTANFGGGAYLYSSLAILNGNTITSNTAQYSGGGMRLSSSPATLSANVITSNTAGLGGGVFLGNSDATLINTIAADNWGNTAGSGLYVLASSPRLLHITLARNTGGDGSGVYVTNDGSALSTVALTNTILVSHTVGISVTGGNTATVNGVLWSGTSITVSQATTATVTAQNQWQGDPTFASDGYHLMAGSAAIDKGVNAGVATDIDGQMRLMGFGPDLGADEFPAPVLLLSKTAAPAAVNPGGTIAYMLVVTNAGILTATNVVLTDTLPAEQRAMSAGWGGIITFALGTMNAGNTAYITFTAQVTTALPAQIPWTMRNIAWVTATEASNWTYADTVLQDCHVRLNDDPTAESESVQAAVDASTSPTDVVKVAGTCAGVQVRPRNDLTTTGVVTQVVYISKTITIRGGYTTTNWTTSDPLVNPTTLDAQGLGRVLYITGDISPTIEGLRLTRGDATGLGGDPGGYDGGGGVYIITATATISNNRVFSNTAATGGGMYLRQVPGAAALNGNAVTANTALWDGGGMLLDYSAVMLNGNTIVSNTAQRGGGVYLWYSPATFNANTVTSNTASDRGGGLYLFISAATLNANTVTSNTAGYGGGAYLYYSATTLTNTVVADNRGNSAGGALYIQASSPRLLHTTIARNTGGDGSGVYVTDYGSIFSAVALTNTILVSHTVGISVTGGNTATVDGILWFGTSVTVSQAPTATVTVQNQYQGDPAFAADGYHLTAGSAAINRGVNAGVSTDIDGEPRDAAPDLGVDEYPFSVLLTGVSLTGPTTGAVNAAYTFTATVLPATATTPITYTWQDATGKKQEATSNSLSDTAIFTWTSPGAQVITVTAQNSANAVTGTHTITISAPLPGCSHPLSQVDIFGATSGFTGTLYAFTAAIIPSDATMPVTYTWSPTPVNGQGTADAVYQWATPGVYTLTLTAENCGGGVTDTHTITISALSFTGDYEPNDTCDQANLIATDGTEQIQSFYKAADEDWVAFYATVGITYAIEVRVPPTSTADVALNMYDACPSGGSFDDSNPEFSPDIRLTFQAPASGLYYLRLTNIYTNTYGPDTIYYLSVRALRDVLPSGAVILVAGRLRENDPLQANIHHVTDALYNFAIMHGCSGQIRYLATDTARVGVDDTPTKKHLGDAITQWAAGKVGLDRPLTLYLMDHGNYDRFYLDGPAGEVITPVDLDGWLDQLEDAVPEVKVNVIVEACHSGSFIDPDKDVSKVGRTVIASTSPQAVAYASEEGALFSDVLLNGLQQGLNLRQAYEEGVWAVRQSHPDQTPWLDADGDGKPDPTSQGLAAAQRSLACEVIPPQANWPPYIMQAEIRNLKGDQGEIWARALDDHQVKWMWTTIYPPSWNPPTSSEEMITGTPPVYLPPLGSGWNGVTYGGFTEIGVYRIVVYAVDDAGLEARPKEIQVQVGWQVYLPIVLR